MEHFVQEQDKNYNVSEFTLKSIIKSTNKLYKYTAVLSNKTMTVTIHFGSSDRDGVPFEQYQDRTGLGLYTDFDNFNVVKARAWYLKNKTYINKQFWTSKGLEYVFLQTYK